MATAAVTNNFTNGTPADAEQVDTNFSELVSFLNSQVIHKDGSKAMTAAFDAGSQKIVNVSGGSAATDAANMTNVVDSIPVGTMMAFGGTVIPSLWLLCDGSTKSRTTYAALFAVIGTAYNTGGEAGTDFRLPNFQDRYPIGDSGTLTLGGYVGSNDAVAVAHTHGHPDHAHGHTLGVSGSVTGVGAHEHFFSFNTLNSGPFEDSNVSSDHGGTTVGTLSGTTTGGGNHSHGFSGSITGGVNNGNAGTTNSQSPTASGTNANRPQSVVVNWIIRAGV